jgi:hypothetical protein
VQDVAHVDGDERAEAAHDEHAGGKRDDDEEQASVVEDEARACFMSARTRGMPVFSLMRSVLRLERAACLRGTMRESEAMSEPEAMKLAESR